MAKRGRKRIKTQVSWRLDKDLMTRLDRYAQESGVEKTLIIERALVVELDRRDGLPVSLHRTELLLANTTAAEQKSLARWMVLLRLPQDKLPSLERASIEAILILMAARHWDKYDETLAEYGWPPGADEEARFLG